MAIEDFEWEAEVELTRPSQARLVAAAEAGARVPAARATAGWFARLRSSVWLEPALRLFGLALLLGVLAGIGVVATTYAKPGVQLPDGSRTLTLALGTSWLKPSPAPSVAAAPSAVASAVAAAEPAQATPPAASTEPAPSGPVPVGITPDGKVVLNVASADELTKLPGVGPKRANAIVALRAKLKRFKHPTDLLRVKGIGPRSLQRMLPHLVLD
jgi:competence ComEA-like helix-hairpin-helix protein